MMRTKCLFAHSPSLRASIRVYADKLSGKTPKARDERTPKLAPPPTTGGWMDSDRPRVLWALGDVKLGYTVRDEKGSNF